MIRSYFKSKLLYTFFLGIACLAVFTLFVCINESKTSHKNNNQTTPTTNQHSINSNSSTQKDTANTLKPPTFSSHTHLNFSGQNELYSDQLPQSHIDELNKELQNNLSLVNTKATIREDKTVIIHSQDRLKTISVAHLDTNGNIVISEYNQPISSDLTKDNQ